MQAATNAQPSSSLLWFIIIFSMAFHVVILILGKTIWVNWQLTEPLIHTALEISGSLVALFVAMFLLHYEKFQRGSHYNTQIATALIAMGILDGFHALVPIGNTFVWLHTFATFTGGLLFLSIYLPKEWTECQKIKWWQLWVVLTVLISTLSISFPNVVPNMTEHGEFTHIPVTLNILGGSFFFISAIKLIWIYKHYRNIDDLLFSLHCFLFGAAAIMFKESSLWDSTWWGWHILRFLAYVTALWFIVRTEENILVQLNSYSTNLEKKVAEKTQQLEATNINLSNTLNKMEVTQQLLIEKEQHASQAQIATQKALDDLTLAKDSLVQAEKMASLGQLVAGVAHELNTPLGVSVTAISAITDNNRNLLASINEGNLTKKYLIQSIEQQLTSSDMIERSLDSANSLIQNFKSIAVDQHLDPKVEIDLAEHMNKVINMVKLLFKGKHIDITLNAQNTKKLITYPNALNQILTNLLINSFIHGFENDTTGNITITVRDEANTLTIDYKDNGQGIDDSIRNKIFDPFVTTKRGSGSTGLGMNIVFNLVTSKLKGNIQCVEVPSGCNFLIEIPIADNVTSH